jgi:hypothetical protein
LTPLALCPRIIVFRAFVDQLPKLDVAGSTPVARSFILRNQTIARMVFMPSVLSSGGAG